jgi:hypothetical protein
MISRTFVGVIMAALFTSSAFAQPPSRVALNLDSSEAEAVLAILDKRALNRRVTEADWQKLFSTTPYRRLKQGEMSMDQRFSDEEFMKFVTTLDARREKFRPDPAAMAVRRRPSRGTASPDLSAAAGKHPRRRLSSDQGTVQQLRVRLVHSTLFLYLDPKKTRAHLENTFAHEAHHVGLASVEAAYEERIKSMPENSRRAAHWMGAFREGMAVLAAAGSPDVHPLADFSEPYGSVWNLEANRFVANLDELNRFFLDTVHGDLLNDAVLHEGRIFFGFGSGPWYTVGYRMAVAIEREFGRTALVATYADPRQFVARYNEAAASENAKTGAHLPLFSAEILKAVGSEDR